MTSESYEYLQKKLIDLKIKQAKTELKLNFSIMSLENMQRFNYLDKKYRSCAFLQAYFILKKNELFRFIENANAENIDKISFDIHNEQVINFLKNIDSLTKLGEIELNCEKNKIRKNIRKLEEAIEELDYMILESLPKNNYSS